MPTCPPGHAAAFDLVEPPDGDSPVLVEIPHASVALDAPALAAIAAPARCIARDADLYVDALFADSPQLGASLLVARRSRYFIDLNRAEDDFDGAAVSGGPSLDRPRGVIWRLSSDGMAVHEQPLPHQEYERRCALLWRPYHNLIDELLQRKRERFGFAVMLCAHSMPTPRSRGLRSIVAGQQADVVPGTQGRTTADGRWIDLVDAQARAHNWNVQHDAPYRGGFTTSHYGRPAEHMHVVQLELARRLYMDEQNLTLRPDGFANVKRFARGLVAKLVDEAHGVYRSQLPEHES